MTNHDDPRSRRVLEAALQTFIRYGFRRTTMGDIAEAAALSRPALYLLFPNKEAIFEAVVADHCARALADIRSRLPSLPDRRARLGYAFERWSVETYALTTTHPDARELVDGSLVLARATFQSCYRDFQALLAEEILGDDPLRQPKAALLTAASQGFKSDAPTVDQYRERLAQSIGVVLRA